MKKSIKKLGKLKMFKTTNISKKIGANIKMHRILQNRSRKWLGDKIGVSYHQIQNYETGKQKISANNLFIISKYLKTAIQKFYSNL